MPDSARLTGHQIGLVLLGALVTFVDGYDLQLLPGLVPTLAHEWGVTPSAFALPLSATLVGYAVGGILLAPLGDQYGRKPVLAAMLGLSGASVAASAWAHSTEALILWRFLTGIGIGTAIINALSLIADGTPPARRATMITLAMIALSLGSILSGLLTAAFLPRWGWRPLFLIGGAIPLLLAPVAGLWRGTPPVAPRLPERRPGLRAILAPELRGRTLTLWALFLLTSFLMFFLASWWPTLLVRLGWTPAAAARDAVLSQAGGVIGGLIGARAIDRGRAGFMLVLLYGAAVAVTLAFPLAGSAAAIVTLIFCAGFAVGGAQYAISALSAILYPSQIRATGMGWAGSISRIGSISAPLVGGWSIAFMPPATIVAWLALPAAAALVAALALRRQEAPVR